MRSKLARLLHVNYVPHTAVNALEMWQAATYDNTTIDSELAALSSWGFGAARIFLHYGVYMTDKHVRKEVLKWHTDLCQKRPTLCASTIPSTSLPSMESKSCLYCSTTSGIRRGTSGHSRHRGHMCTTRAGCLRHAAHYCPLLQVQCPGKDLLLNPGVWNSTLRPYVLDVVRTFANDSRVLLWDLYNEPGNLNTSKFVLGRIYACHNTSGLLRRQHLGCCEGSAFFALATECVHVGAQCGADTTVDERYVCIK